LCLKLKNMMYRCKQIKDFNDITPGRLLSYSFVASLYF
jgi:hypothetical protein